MERIVFNATDEMAAAIRGQAQERRITRSEIIREALEEYFERRGTTMDERIEWGKPTSKSDDPAGQLAGVGAS